ncbi:MAG: hypothetical protein R2941_23160 [Desulfobacterales bacterium]
MQKKAGKNYLGTVRSDHIIILTKTEAVTGIAGKWNGKRKEVGKQTIVCHKNAYGYYKICFRISGL